MTAPNDTAPAAATAVTWNDGELVLVRSFDAPRDLVYRAWTETDYFTQWWGPHGSTLPFCTLDVRPGGILHFCHRFADYPDVWVRGEYQEVAPPERISFTCWFSDPEGNRQDRPGFPVEMRIAVDFEEIAGGTRMTMRQTGLVEDQGEVQGWTEGLERLEALLAGA